MQTSLAVGAVLAVVLLGTASAYAVSPGGGEELSPVRFEDTIATGLAGVDVQRARAAGLEIPRVQVFYGQYHYVVGYYGIESAVAALADPTTTDRFGRPLAVFVTDYGGTDPRLTDAGLLTLGTETAVTWTRAREAAFVVGSRARTPGGPAIVPFGDRSAAEAFARTYGGSVRDFESLESAVDPPRSWRTARDERLTAGRAWAATTRDDVSPLLDRPVSVVVGEDAPTLAAAVDRAPPNTTVRVPPGRHDVNLTVAKPVTIRGSGSATILDGGGTGSVLTIEHPAVAVTDLRVTGVGDRDLGTVRREAGDRWDAKIRLVYGYGDAAVRFQAAPGSFVHDVSVDTPANGVVILNSSGTVVEGLTVRGTADPADGFMGVLPMYSRVLVQDSDVRGGRDGVYTHRADGTVIRNVRFEGMRFGIHEMYTSDTLLANNSAVDTTAGVIIMTRPTGNTVVDNTLADSESGLVTAGSATIATGNVLVGNGRGLAIGTARSSYVDNVIAANEVGVSEETLLPTSDVFGNDIVWNDRAVDTGRGVQLLWASAGRGNYWGDVPGQDRDGDGVVDRPFRPTAAVDVAAMRSAGGAVLAESPTVALARAFQQAVPGLRPSGVLDPAPLADPVHPAVLDRVREAHS